MSVREVQGFLANPYDVEVSPEFIGSVAEAARSSAARLRRSITPASPISPPFRRLSG